jgi:hypothetical protein
VLGQQGDQEQTPAALVGGAGPAQPGAARHDKRGYVYPGTVTVTAMVIRIRV